MSDSDDDLIASLEVPETQPNPPRRTPQHPSQPKRSKQANTSDYDLSDNSILANLSIPSPSKLCGTSGSSTSAIPSNATTAPTQQLTVPVATRNINKSHTIMVHPKQRGNPILKSITNVPWEFEDGILVDYVVGATAGILFLSLRYHQLNPDYIHGRLKDLGKRYELRVLLVLVDTKEPTNALKNLTQICLLADLTLMLAWNAEEAGRVVETYKMFESKPPDLIMARAQQYPHQKLVTALTNIKPVNKTDAMTLLQNYGSLANLIRSSEDNLAMCAGLGPRKAKRLNAIFNEPFLRK